MKKVCLKFGCALFVGVLCLIFFKTPTIEAVNCKKGYDDCEKQCAGQPGRSEQCRGVCKESNAATVPDGYDSIDSWQEDMKDNFDRGDSTFDVSGGDGFNKSNIADGTANGKIKRSAQRIWGSFTLIAQILSFAGIVILGIRYMYMSADQRADVKKTFVYLIIGMILVFGASTVVQFVTNASTTVLK